MMRHRHISGVTASMLAVSLGGGEGGGEWASVMVWLVTKSIIGDSRKIDQWRRGW